MKTQVQKWGNSLGVRIPKVFAAQLGIKENTPVELEIKDETIILRAGSELTLEQLLAGITAENVHDEIDTGLSVGAEIW